MDQKGKNALKIDDLYGKYKNKKGKIKKHLIMGGIRFDIDPKYEIIDLGMTFKPINSLFKSRTGSLWFSSSCQR